MKSHKFGPVQHTSADNDHPYQKCQLCGKVCFQEGDDYFNMVCMSVNREMEDLRKKLENKS